MKNRLPLLLALALCLAPLTSVAVAESPETGETWESTFQMTMEGAESFAMPPTTTTFCRPRNEAWNEPPAPDNSDCTMSDVKRSGNTLTWNMTCTKPPATGTGTMTFEGDASYTGEMSMTSSEGSMLMKMSGRRTGQACDLGAQKRQIAAAEAHAARGQAQAAQAMADTCAQAATSGQSYVFIGPMAMCKEPGQLAAFCAALATEAGYSGAKANASMGVDLAKAAETCKVDPGKLHDELCVKALASESLDFLVKECPAQSQVIARRECAGRKYTQLAGSKYQGFCGQYAQAEMEAADADPKTSTMEKAKKGLRGLFRK